MQPVSYCPLAITSLARCSLPLCRVQPLVTPYYCPMCGLYATSEEQLRMHMLGELFHSVGLCCCCVGITNRRKELLRIHMLGEFHDLLPC